MSELERNELDRLELLGVKYLVYDADSRYVVRECRTRKEAEEFIKSIKSANRNKRRIRFNYDIRTRAGS